MARIQVKYTKVQPYTHDLKGAVRWLDITTGELFPDDTSADRMSSGYQPTGVTGEYRNADGSHTVQQMVYLPPATDYPDGNPKSAQGAKKYSLRYLPLPAAVSVNQALEDGAKKYGPANWRETGVAATVYVDAAMRHLAQWFDGGQQFAVDSGVHNLGHAMACLAIIIDAQHAGKLIDDRPSACADTDALLLR